MLDAPLIRHGEHLIAPVGGSPDAFQSARSLLELLAQRVAYVGPSGFGQLTTLLDQMLRAARTVALAEVPFLRTSGRPR